ncbi:cellulose binding domain-containing protein [Micromonospora costi]|uniref:cellulose binding domain-containing protein n=1 Tax=Micromonospora costi TaxID=1530042 RepID=UPI001F4E2E0F|nr:cellulose binding domain-containing protein [Micromonospora costi]
MAELVHRCLAKRPEDRPASAEVAHTLAGAAGVSAAVPVSPAPGPVDPEWLANAGTTILPFSADTDALAYSGARTTRATTRRRRLEAAGVAAGLVAVTGAIWSATSRSPVGGGEPLQARMGQDRQAPCQVNYALRRDSGKDFDADLILTNTGEQDLRNWAISFAFPGAQTVVRATPADVRQEGQRVLIRPAATSASLAPGTSEKITLTGRYIEANPLPLDFQVADSKCEARVAGIPGSTAPSTKTPTTAPTRTATTTSGAKSDGSESTRDSRDGSGVKGAPARGGGDKQEADASKGDGKGKGGGKGKNR